MQEERVSLYLAQGSIKKVKIQGRIKEEGVAVVLSNSKADGTLLIYMLGRGRLVVSKRENSVEATQVKLKKETRALLTDLAAKYAEVERNTAEGRDLLREYYKKIDQIEQKTKREES